MEAQKHKFEAGEGHTCEVRTATRRFACMSNHIGNRAECFFDIAQQKLRVSYTNDAYRHRTVWGRHTKTTHCSFAHTSGYSLTTSLKDVRSPDMPPGPRPRSPANASASRLSRHQPSWSRQLERLRLSASRVFSGHLPGCVCRICCRLR